MLRSLKELRLRRNLGGSGGGMEEQIYTEDNAQNFHDEVINLWSKTV